MPGRTLEFIFKGTNRSAIRALTEVASQSEKTSRKIAGDNRKMAGTFKQVGDSAHRVRGSVSGLAGAIGAGGLAFGIGSVVKAGMEWQKQQAQLRGALQNTGQMSAKTLEGLNRAAEGAASHGGFGAAENVHALTQFVTATKDASKAQRDLGLATDISRRTGKDFTLTTRALMMLENGRTTGLARMGLAVPKVTTAEDALKNARKSGHDQLLALTAAGYKFTAAQKAQYALGHQITPQMLAQAKAQDALGSKQAAFAALQARFGGATSAFSKTTAGRISNMQNAWKSLQEQLGAGLLPIVGKVLGVAAKLFGVLNKHRVVLYVLLGGIAAVSTVLAAHAAITAVAEAKNYLLIASNRLLGTSFAVTGVAEEGAAGATTLLGAAMSALPVLALITGLVLLVTHFKQVKEGATIAWKWIKTAAADTFKWIKGNWPLLAGILLAPFTFGNSIIVGLFHKQLLGAAKSVVKTLGRAFSTVGDAITWPFRKAWQVIKGIANAIVSAFRWVVDKVKSAFHFITSLPGKIGHAAGSLLHTATFGLLHTGGEVKPKYMAAGGPVGSDRIPGWLSPGEYVLNRQQTAQAGVGALDAWRHGGGPPGGGQNFTITPSPVVLNLDGRRIAEGVVRYTLGRNARGSTSLVGGAMTTGVRTA